MKPSYLLIILASIIIVSSIMIGALFPVELMFSVEPGIGTSYMLLGP